MSPDDPRHGTNAGYVAGCRRTDCCWPAKSRYDKRRRHEFHTTGVRRRVSAIGYRRRVQALACMGWSLTELADLMGVAHSSFCMPLYRGTWVSLEKHRSFAELYERLCMTESTGPRVRQTKGYATRNGWVPPLAWDDIDDPNEIPGTGSSAALVDDVAVQRALEGRGGLGLNRAERTEALRRHLARGGTEGSFQLLTGIRSDRYRSTDTGHEREGSR